MNKKIQKLPLGIPLAVSTAGTVLALWMRGGRRLHVLFGAALVVLSALHGAQHALKMKQDAKRLLGAAGMPRQETEKELLSLKKFCSRLEVRRFMVGRVRVYNPMLVGNAPLADQLEAYAKSFRGVVEAAANPATGSLLVTYDPVELRRVPGLKKLEERLLKTESR